MGTVDETNLRILRIMIFPAVPVSNTKVSVLLETLLVDGSVHRTYAKDVTALLSAATKTSGNDFLAAVEADARTALNIP